MNILKYVLVLLLMCAVSTAAADELQLGQKGYMHERMHPYYQPFFDSNQCQCGVGECRPTKWRIDPSSPTNIEVKVDDYWLDVPTHALLKPRRYPPELAEFPAHVCAYITLPRITRGSRKFGIVVECVLITGTS